MGSLGSKLLNCHCALGAPGELGKHADAGVPLQFLTSLPGWGLRLDFVKACQVRPMCSQDREVLS